VIIKVLCCASFSCRYPPA